MSDINIASLSNQMRLMAAKAQGESVENNPAPFGHIFNNALNQVNNLNLTADELRSQYEMGSNDVSIGEVMIATQKSSLAFEATLRVRNKLVQAYQDIMNMPV